MNRVALGQGKRQLDRGAFVEDIGTVTGGAGKDRRAGWAAVGRGDQSVADRFVERFDQTGVDTRVEVHPPDRATLQHRDDGRDERPRVADDPAAGLGQGHRPVRAKGLGQRGLDRLAVGGERRVMALMQGRESPADVQQPRGETGVTDGLEDPPGCEDRASPGLRITLL